MINKDFFAALSDLERERGIDKEIIMAAIESALTSACKKQYGEATNVMVKLNAEKTSIKVYSYKTVVAEVEDIEKEISIEEAREKKKTSQIGDIVYTEINPKDFGRIAAQTAKQVVIQAMREAERSNAFSQYSERENELIIGVINRINPDDGTMYIEIGKNQMEGTLIPSDQNPNEKFNVGDRIKVLVKRVRETPKGLQITLSRTSPVFVVKLFEVEVPEIRAGIVVVKNIVREAGYRTKIAVACNDEDVDPVGACVGNKGARVNAIINELGGEKVDIIAYSDDILDYIARALNPAKVLMVQANEDTKEAKVIVPDDKLSLAIGKDGQNARLAARLTNWKIDVKSYTNALAEGLLDEHNIEEEDMYADVRKRHEEAENEDKLEE